jgi:hypothetical protein
MFHWINVPLIGGLFYLTSVTCAQATNGPHSVEAPSINHVFFVDGAKYATLASAVAALPTATIAGNKYQYGEVHIAPGKYTIKSGVTIKSPYVTIIGAGSASTRITCATSGDCIQFINVPFTVYNGRSGLENLTLVSNGSESQVGVHTKDMTVGFFLHDVVFDSFNGPRAVGWWAENARAWTERTNIERAWFNFCTTAIKLSVAGSMGATGSFGHHTWVDLQINSDAGQTAIQLTDNAVLYASIITGVVNVGNAAGNSTIFSLEGTSSVTSTVFLNLLADLTGATTATGVNARPRTSFAASGNFTGFTSNIGPGTIVSTMPVGASPILLFANSQTVGLANSTSGVGTWVQGNVGSAGNFYQGIGINVHFDGKNWVTGDDGLNNGGSLILTGHGDGEIHFYSIPSSGGSPQIISPLTLDSTYLQATIDSAGNTTVTKLVTSRDCSANGTSASPSVVPCGSAASGAVSCAANASTTTCVVNTTAVTANSNIAITPSVADGKRLGVTCNTALNFSTAPLLAAKSAGISFTLNMPKFDTNPACFEYTIIN